MILELAALLCAGLFAGAALYVSLVEHPARLECGPALAIAEFGPSYRRGGVMQASLAVGGCLSAVAAWTQGSPTPVLIAGLLLGVLIPFTLIVILPTNKRLLDAGLDRSAPETAALLARWGRLHAVRSVVGGVAFLLLGLHRGGIL
jgi:Anthrone oxygenase